MFEPYSKDSSKISREKFLSLALKTAALTYMTINAAGCSRAPEAPVALKKLSNRAYENITILGEFYLEDFPLKNFNIGQALDNFLYGEPKPHPLENKMLELVGIPSSILAMLYIDKSFMPMIYMNKAERKRLFLKWRTSQDPFQRGIYAIMHSLCMTLVSHEADFQTYTGFII